MCKIFWDTKAKEKQSHYSPWKAQKFPRGWGSQISRQSALEGGNVVSPTHRPPLPSKKYSCYSFPLGTAVAQWLSCCATNRKAAGSIPDGDSGIFPIALWSWGRLINEYQEHFVGGKGGRCIGLTTYHHPVPLSCNLGTLTSWNPLGHSRPVTGLIYLYSFLLVDESTRGP